MAVPHPRSAAARADGPQRTVSVAGKIARGIRDWFASVKSGWQDFWFAPTDPTTLGVLRILSGLMLLYTHAVWGLELDAFFGSRGWQAPELVHALQSEQFAYSFWWWVPEGWMHTVHVASLVVLGLFTVGLFADVTAVLACVIAISYAHRAPAALFGLDQINTMLALYLAIGGCGQALSFDRLRARYRKIRRAVDTGSGEVDLAPPPSSRANLGIRLIQVHMCVIYFFAGVSKLQGTAWWNGDAMWLAFANLEYQSADMTWLARFPRLINLITHTTVIWEISFCALVWIPVLRPVVLAMAVVLHVGIGAVLGMWTFGLVMLIGCASFIRPSEIKSLALLLWSSDQAEPHVVRYDGACIGCRREAVLVKFFDLFDRIRLEEAGHETGNDQPAESRPRWARFVSARHRHRDSVASGLNGQELHADAEFVDDGFGDEEEEDAAVAGESEDGPLVLCIQRTSSQQQALCRYLAKRGYRVVEAADVDEGVALAETQEPDCVILAGKRLDVDQFAGFQNRIAEIDDVSMVSLVLLAPQQRHFLSQLRMNRAERILVQPVSLRELRGEIVSAMSSRTESSDNSKTELDL